jgi:hypothetical protein
MHRTTQSPFVNKTHVRLSWKDTALKFEFTLQEYEGNVNN